MIFIIYFMRIIYCMITTVVGLSNTLKCSVHLVGGISNFA